MHEALYGPDGFFMRNDAGPAAHFRTSVHASPLFAHALLRLLDRVDAALGRPDRLDVVDVGAGRGELLTQLAALAPPALADRLRLTAVELAPRPPDLAADITWRADLPAGVTGLLVANEWLDNVPLDIARDGAVPPGRPGHGGGGDTGTPARPGGRAVGAPLVAGAPRPPRRAGPLPGRGVGGGGAGGAPRPGARHRLRPPARRATGRRHPDRLPARPPGAAAPRRVAGPHRACGGGLGRGRRVRGG